MSEQMELEKWVTVPCFLSGYRETTTVQIFFEPEATNHPEISQAEGEAMCDEWPLMFRRPGDSEATPFKVPNWFYYWRDTKAFVNGVRATTKGTNCSFVEIGGQEQWYALYDVKEKPGYVEYLMKQQVTLSSDVWTSVLYSAEGIDDFARGCRHEEGHREDWVTWWPSGGDPVGDDMGGPGLQNNFPDMIPDHMEMWRNGILQPGSSLDFEQTLSKTYPDTGIDQDDGQEHNQRKILGGYYPYSNSNLYWTNGTADFEDWSKGGKQW